MNHNFGLGDTVVIYRRSSVLDNWKQLHQGYVIATTRNSIKIKVKLAKFLIFKVEKNFWIDLENPRYLKAELIK